VKEHQGGWYEFDPSEYERCPHHGCPAVRVAYNSGAVCLLEWLAERASDKRVLDVLPREGRLAGVVLEGGFVLPVERVSDIARSGKAREVGLDLTGWTVTDILYLPAHTPADNREGLAVEIKPRNKQSPGVLLHLNLGVMAYLLFDEEMRRACP